MRIIKILLLLLIAGCTSIVEGTWKAENGDRIVIEQSAGDSNTGMWKYYEDDKVLYEGEYVIDGYAEEIGFMNQKGETSVFAGELKDEQLLFYASDSKRGVEKITFTR